MRLNAYPTGELNSGVPHLDTGCFSPDDVDKYGCASLFVMIVGSFSAIRKQIFIND